MFRKHATNTFTFEHKMKCSVPHEAKLIHTALYNQKLNYCKMSKISFTRCCLKLFYAAMLLGSCFLTPRNVFAHDRPGNGRIAEPEQTIRGTIKDAGGNPLPGATIALKGSAVSTTSDANGAFAITVPDNNSILVVSYVGYATKEVFAGTSTTIDVVLQANA